MAHKSLEGQLSTTSGLPNSGVLARAHRAGVAGGVPVPGDGLPAPGAELSRATQLLPPRLGSQDLAPGGTGQAGLTGYRNQAPLESFVLVGHSALSV